ncbi:MAG TPA: alpha/beta fold hydrolase [Opitutaceae bacterium]|nr:alpha/beta fold hydrolase [Opitutaceae bacterium]
MKKLLRFLTFGFRCVVNGLAIFGLYHLWTNLVPSQTAEVKFVEELDEQYWPAQLPSGETPRGIVIFVHGLGGHYKNTWRASNGALLMDLINQEPELAAYDLCSLGYPSKIAADMTSISSVMERVADFIDLKTPEYHRVILVCHSLGGLIGRGALKRSNFGNRPHQRCTFITLGTPFAGSSLADFGTLLPGVTSYQTQALRTVDPNSEVLNGDWERIRRNWGSKLRHFSGFETKAVSANQLVVKPDSANFNVKKERGDEAVAFAADHFTICKPPTAADPGFQTIKRWVLGRADGTAIDFSSLPEGAVFKPFAIVEMNGEIEINRDLHIPLGSRLVISPGTLIKVRNGAILTVEGRIVAKGTAEKPIVFDFDEASCSEAAVFLKGPFVEDSEFTHCLFQHGNGVALEKPDPRREEKNDPRHFWYDLTKRVLPEERADYIKRLGGAVVLLSASKVVFQHCTFRRNEAWNGGAAVLLNSRGIKFQHCRFAENRGAFGGGALYTQSSELVLENCNFLRNYASAPTAERVRLYHGTAENKSDSDAALGRPKHACGGAIYAGYRSQLNARYDNVLESNEAAWAGGGAYFLDTSPDAASRDASMLVGVRFSSNIAGNKGGGLYLDGLSRVHVADPIYERNVGKQVTEAESPEHSLVNEAAAMMIARDAMAAAGSSPAPIEAGKEKGPRTLPSPLAVENRFMANPGSFKVTSGREIDTVIIHHVSAINWATDKLLRTKNRARVEAFERANPVAERKFDPRTCQEIFEIYGVSSHYLIDRDGHVIRLVADKDIAFHAGESAMPDGRKNVNDFSLGIELISSHPDDDRDVRSGRTPAYTEAQYESLLRLIAGLRAQYRIPPSHVLGHDDIAPKRKKDPGPLFDWKRVRAALHAEPAPR